MATGVKRKKPPSVKQLRARAKFVKMVRARARALKAEKRAAGIRTKRPATKRATAKKRNSAWDLSKPTTRKKYVDRSYRGRGSKAHRRRYGTSTPKGMSWGQTPRMKRKLPNPVSCVKNGKRLYGAAAQAVLASRAARSRRNGTVKSPTSTRTATRTATDAKTWGNVTVTGGAGRGATTSVTIKPVAKRRNGIFRTAARAAISKRLHAPITFGRKRKKSRSKSSSSKPRGGTFIREGYGLIRNRGRRRNSGAPAGIEQMHEKFLGRPSKGAFDIVAPAGTPKDVAVLGELTKLKTEDEEFCFDKGEAYMGADSKGNLYVLGDVQVESNTSFGAIEEICYLARKDHINPARIRGSRRRKARRNPGTLTEYYHYFGEEGGALPKLKTDRDGMMHITGGSYTIEPEGITN